MSIRTILRDWWRGYSQADIDSLERKVSAKHKPGGLVILEPAEWRAFSAGYCVNHLHRGDPCVAIILRSPL